MARLLTSHNTMQSINILIYLGTGSCLLPIIVCRSEPQIVAALTLPNISPSSISGTSAISLSKSSLGPLKTTLCASVDVALSARTDNSLPVDNAGKIFAEFDKLNSNLFNSTILNETIFELKMNGNTSNARSSNFNNLNTTARKICCNCSDSVARVRAATGKLYNLCCANRSLALIIVQVIVLL